MYTGQQNMFCKAMSNAVSFRIPGDSNSLTFNPCCMYGEFFPFQPAFFSRKRKMFVEATDYLPGCDTCKLKEQTDPGSGQRVFSNNTIPDGIGDSIYKLEIVIDTTCNAACIQCGSAQSSLWRNEVAARNSKFIHIQPESEIDTKIELIKNTIDIQQVKEWHFWGGEPLLTDTHLKFLSDINDLKNVRLYYTTNTSIFPDENVLKLWEKCKSVIIMFSVDGIGDRFHYMRWPLSWDKAVGNINLFRKFAPANVDFRINYCYTPINVVYTSELENYFNDYFGCDKIIHIKGEGTNFAISGTPLKLRDDLYKQLGENHPVSTILKEVPLTDAHSMIEHLTYWDKVRKLNWKAVFPESVKYFV